MDLKLTQQQLYALLGLPITEEMGNLQVVIKNVNTGAIVSETMLEDLFEGLIHCPCDLNEV